MFFELVIKFKQKKFVFICLSNFEMFILQKHQNYFFLSVPMKS